MGSGHLRKMLDSSKHTRFLMIVLIKKSSYSIAELLISFQESSKLLPCSPGSYDQYIPRGFTLPATEEGESAF